jgi:hypothetical protein
MASLEFTSGQCEVPILDLIAFLEFTPGSVADPGCFISDPDPNIIIIIYLQPEYIPPA